MTAKPGHESMKPGIDLPSVVMPVRCIRWGIVVALVICVLCKPLAIISISAYQQFISPHKGWHCAYAALHGGPSCSAYGKEVIANYGCLWGALLLRNRFGDCNEAANIIASNSMGEQAGKQCADSCQKSEKDCADGCVRGCTGGRQGTATQPGPVRPVPRPVQPRPSPQTKIQLVTPVSGRTFAIDGNAHMPTIFAQARITGISPDPTASTAFTWTVQLRFRASDCPNGPDRTINPPDIVQTVVGGKFNILFDRMGVRGGKLTIMVQATLAGRTLQAQSNNLRIVGTNPLLESVRAAMPHDTLQRIARHESGARQFYAAASGGTSPYPLFSRDKLGGVGIMQITNPRPTDDEVWDWTANVTGGIQIFNKKLAVARNYPARVRASAGFANLVARFNQERVHRGLPPVSIDLPDFKSGNFDDNLQELELDAIRGFNGWAGDDGMGFDPPVLHEFRVALDAAGNLRVNIDPVTNRGTAIWERVPEDARPLNSGDPKYVKNVLSQEP